MVTASVALAVAVGVFGASFGVLAVASGLSVTKTCALSLLVFTGASQFAAVGVLDGGGSAAAAFGSAMLLAARNAAYGVALAPLARRWAAPVRVVAAQLTIDETTAMALAQRKPADQSLAFWVTGVALFACWNAGTLLGALGGSAIGDPRDYGLDAAFPAGFVALLVPHVQRRDGRMAAVLGGTAALLLVPFVPVGVPILVAALACLVGLRKPT